MNEAKGCKDFFTTIFVGLAVIVAGFVLLMGFATSEDSAVNRLAQYAHEQELAALPQNDEQYALNKQAEVAQVLAADIVAVAVSGDIAQTKTAGYIPTTIFGLAALFAALGFLNWTLKNSGKPRTGNDEK